jgi:hypothetical protein
MFVPIHVGLWQAAQSELQAVIANCEQKDADIEQLQQNLADALEAAEQSRADMESAMATHASHQGIGLIPFPCSICYAVYGLARQFIDTFFTYCGCSQA